MSLRYHFSYPKNPSISGRMKNLSEIQRFISDSTKVGSQIARDHGATGVEIRLGWYIDHLPPSIASGVGALTEALMVSNFVGFEPASRPVRRTRKFTIYHPEKGQEIWPGANMEVSETNCFFQLHVGNAMSQGWGVFANWRNNNLNRVLAQLESYMGSLDRSHLQADSVLPVTRLQTRT